MIEGMKSGTGLRRDLSEGLRASLPLVAGYVPAAIAFGVTARQAGLDLTETVFMSLVVYSGASQFALAGLIASGAAWAVAAVAGLLLSLRHVLYGPTLVRHLRKLGSWRGALVAYGLTDEVFAVASVELPRVRDPFRWMAAMQTAVFASWIGGTWLGASAGAAATEAVPSLAPALSFALPALFVALLAAMILPVSQSGKRGMGELTGAISAAGAVAAAFHLMSLENWSVLAAGVAGPLAGAVISRRRAGDAR